MIYCDFGSFLDKSLRDRLVCRLREQFRKKILSVVDLTFK